MFFPFFVAQLPCILTNNESRQLIPSAVVLDAADHLQGATRQVFCCLVIASCQNCLASVLHHPQYCCLGLGSSLMLLPWILILPQGSCLCLPLPWLCCLYLAFPLSCLVLPLPRVCCLCLVKNASTTSLLIPTQQLGKCSCHTEYGT